MPKTVVPPMTSGQITRLAELLDFPTGSEIDRLLEDTRMPRPDISTKWRRLRGSFEQAQRASRSANPVLRYVKTALDPSRELGGSGFANLRSDVNEVLALSGLQLKPDGKLVPVARAETADDARLRADRLRARLEERGVHHDVLAFCRPELTERNYFHAVLEATKSVSDKIRTLTGLDGDGSELVQQALSVNNPALLVNDLATETERSEQSGLSQLAQGMYAMFRNRTAHAPKVKWAMEEREALDLLTIASMLHRRLDHARLAPGAPNYARAPSTQGDPRG